MVMMMIARLKLLIAGSMVMTLLACGPLFLTSPSTDLKEAAELEEYLIDLSKKMEGHRLLTGSLPSRLNAEIFFSIVEKYYPDKEIILKVRKYPVKVFIEGNSYALTLCDQQSRLMLYRDLGETITFVDYPYWREGKEVPCQE